MGKTVLFVDDDKDWRFTVETTLQGSGYDVVTASDATEALIKAEGSNIDLIVLDLNLAGEDGVMVMRFLKQNYPGVPIILYTGMDFEPEKIMELLEKGAHSFVRKGPINELVEAVELALQ